MHPRGNMIIFDLDGTLADCDHRRHFVDPSYRDDCYYHFPATLSQNEGWFYKDLSIAMKFIPDWKSFYKECDKDEPIQEVCRVFDFLSFGNAVEIWSGRCNSVRDKTINWLNKNTLYNGQRLRMRPVGDSTPDDILKERWIDDHISDMGNQICHNIEYVFDDRPKVVRMWRRRGIFVFDCNQTGKEF